MKRIILFLIPAAVLFLSDNPCQSKSAYFQEAARNGQLANEGFRRCTRYVQDWLKHSDPTTGLIPGNLSSDRDIWNVHNAAADNYPFMILTAAITDVPLFKGRMLDMLKTEEKVASRLGHLPDTYSFSKKTFQDERADRERILFGASEYVKDGLLPLTEWLGESPWSKRMFDMIDDTWGYVYNAFYTVYLIDKTDAYREAILLALSHLNKYRNFNWEQGAADGFADAIEGAINLYNREALPHVKEWIDGETKILWSLQDTSYRQEAQQWKNTGIIDGSHCDGNFARTTLMYCLWKTQGVTVSPWRADIVFGAVYKNSELFLSIKVDRRWEGKILFDRPRHQAVMRLPLDWPRINQFPEWFTIDSKSLYDVNNLNVNSTKQYKGSNLKNGVFIKLDPDIHYRLKVTER